MSPPLLAGPRMAVANSNGVGESRHGIDGMTLVTSIKLLREELIRATAKAAFHVKREFRALG
ncbi:hypothetical protein B0G38_000312 [Arthrobacter sp. VKM Ac-2550]|nr:hypothetical protein [Arthrobacter sp. VKM Ac-2550]